MPTPPPPPPPPLYKQISGNPAVTTGQSTFQEIPGLSLSLPPQGDNTIAVVTVNLPNPLASGTNFPGALIGLQVGNTYSPVQASFTYPVQIPNNPGRVPTTLIVGVPLTAQSQVVQAVWCGVNGGTVKLDSPATISAVLN